MLTRKLGAVVAILAIALTVLVPATAASAADDCVRDPISGVWNCEVGAGGGGEPGGYNPGGGSTGPADFTPGPSTCTYAGGEDGPEEIPCSRDGGWWSNDRQCYWSLDDPQSSPPAGRDPAVGAWYTCTLYECTDPRGCYTVGQWLLAPPPGIVRYTPAQAAGMLVRTFTLQPITIGMAPESKVHSDDAIGTAAYRRTWVGIPVWLWVDGTSESTWGPLSRTATYGGVTVTATAGVRSLTWSSGDGQTVNCGVGTPFNAAAMADQLAVDSPTCGFRYQRTSGSGTFTVSASTTWVVEWTGGGENGTIAMPLTTSTAQVRVGELQSVNTANYGD